MGERGPKAKPAHLRLLEGNPSRRPINEDEPQPTGIPDCPDYLSEDAKAKWAEILAHVPPGMITVADGPLFEAYCEAWATFKRASELMAASRDMLGNDLTTSAGKPSPFLRVRTEAARTMASLATRLGLSPADRNGLKLGTQKGRGKWSDLIG